MSTIDEALDSLRNELAAVFTSVTAIIGKTHEGLTTENRVLLREARKEAKDLQKDGKSMAAAIIRTSRLDEGEDSIEKKTYAEVNGSLHLLLRGMRAMTAQCFDHVDNGHKQFHEVQGEELALIVREVRRHVTTLSEKMMKGDFTFSTDMQEAHEALRALIRKSDKQQLKRSKKEKFTSRTSLLYLELLTEYEEIVHHTATIFQHCRKCYSPDGFDPGLEMAAIPPAPQQTTPSPSDTDNPQG